MPTEREIADHLAVGDWREYGNALVLHADVPEATARSVLQCSADAARRLVECWVVEPRIFETRRVGDVGGRTWGWYAVGIPAPRLSNEDYAAFLELRERFFEEA